MTVPFAANAVLHDSGRSSSDESAGSRFNEVTAFPTATNRPRSQILPACLLDYRAMDFTRPRKMCQLAIANGLQRDRYPTDCLVNRLGRNDHDMLICAGTACVFWTVTPRLTSDVNFAENRPMMNTHGF